MCSGGLVVRTCGRQSEGCGFDPHPPFLFFLPSQYTLLVPALGVYMIGAKRGGMQVRSTRRAFGGVNFRHCPFKPLPTLAFSGTTNSLQRDSISDSSSSNQPGYLPDYQGDRYTDPQRIAETQALNKAFFDSIGGAPSPPPETPAQQGMNSGGSTVSPSFNNGQYGYQQAYNTQQYGQPLYAASGSASTQYPVLYQPSTTNGMQQQQQQYSNGCTTCRFRRHAF
uniref:Uncharacterized protein n=1 Tax=Caenorhabditis japonica TaxID=281687 RepID=A0A8R1E2G4_CAEJA